MEKNRSAVILRYAEICAQELVEKNSEVLEQINKEKQDIEQELGMSLEEIIKEASRLTEPGD